jgi:hypothetical protein
VSTDGRISITCQRNRQPSTISIFFILGIERKVPSLPVVKKTGKEWKDAGIENFTAMICWHPRLFFHEHLITPFDTDMNDTDTSSGEARVIHGYGWASNMMRFF